MDRTPVEKVDLGPKTRGLKRQRNDGHMRLLTPDQATMSRAQANCGPDEDIRSCETPKVIICNATSGLHKGEAARLVPQDGAIVSPQISKIIESDYEGNLVPERCGSDEDEPMTPRGAMLPRVTSTPPAVKMVAALSPHMDIRDTQFDYKEGNFLTSLKTTTGVEHSSPGEVSSLWSGTGA
jgi:hypothetical protein